MTLIAKNIRWFRKQQEISQTEFASIFGITRASVGAYEEGRAEPKLELISRFAKYYNVDLNAFIDMDMSLVNGTVKDTLIQSEVTGNINTTSKSSFIPEILETSGSSMSTDAVQEHKQPSSHKIVKTKESEIVFYKSVHDSKRFNKSQWPFFSGCDAVFECTPHLERESNTFRDGVFFLCTQIKQEGIYKGVFIEQDRMRLKLIEGEINLADEPKKVWRVLYTINSINRILE